MRRSLAAAAACVVVVVCAPAIAVAQAPASVGFTFEPASASGAPTGRSYFDYSLAPGDAIQDYVRLANLTDHDRAGRLRAAPARPAQDRGRCVGVATVHDPHRPRPERDHLSFPAWYTDR